MSPEENPPEMDMGWGKILIISLLKDVLIWF
jgi:hypothetical protein